MANFSWRQRRHFLMLCCRQVLVLVCPRCLLGAMCMRIRRYWISSFCF